MTAIEETTQEVSRLKTFCAGAGVAMMVTAASKALQFTELAQSYPAESGLASGVGYGLALGIAFNTLGATAARWTNLQMAYGQATPLGHTGGFNTHIAIIAAAGGWLGYSYGKDEVATQRHLLEKPALYQENTPTTAKPTVVASSLGQEWVIG